MGLARVTPPLLLEEMTVMPCRNAGPREPKRGHCIFTELDRNGTVRGLHATMSDDAYTFLGNSRAGATLFMDIAGFESDDLARAHAVSLLDQHHSTDLVEIWRATRLIGQIPRLDPAGPAAIGG